MPMRVAILDSFRQHRRIALSYPAAMSILTAIVIQIVYVGWRNQRLTHAIGYLAAIWLGFLITDVLVNISPKPATGFPVRHQVRRELLVILGCVALGLVFLIVRYSSEWATFQGFRRVALVSLIIFVFPIALASIFLFLYRYKPGELGVNKRYWYLPLVVNFTIAGITLAVDPQLSHWRSSFRAYGLVRGLYTGLILSGLSEEFTRMLLQTRLGEAFKDKGSGFVAATIIWAATHVPLDHSQSPMMSLTQVTVGASHIVPLGLLWGYMTHRSKSLLPAVISHGLNLSGLQNQI
jgi:membrane protease YdiL (CAAX protease family)